jgi:hypothetical protein
MYNSRLKGFMWYFNAGKKNIRSEPEMVDNARK